MSEQVELAVVVRSTKPIHFQGNGHVPIDSAQRIESVAERCLRSRHERC